MKNLGKLSILAAGALIVAACGGSDGSNGTTPSGQSITRGAVSAVAAGQITVNGVVLTTAGAAVRVDDNPGGLDDVRVGDVVTVKGTFDDRLGGAAEIEVHHGVHGMVDDKGTDFVVVAGERIQVDDTTHFDDRLGTRLDAVGVGSVVMVSATPVVRVPGGVDDKGGLRASRIDLSPRDGGNGADDHDSDVKGFVSNVSGTSFELRSTPDDARYWSVSFAGVATPAGFGEDAYVEVHTVTPVAAGAGAVIGTITASSIHLEDALSGSRIEIEGYVTSVSGGTFVNGDSFVAGGVKVQTSASTRYALGVASDLIVGVKVEVHGSMSGGVLQATKVSFRPGYRITGTVASFTGGDLSVLGVHVQLPSWVENDLSATLGNGVKVEIRGELSADGQGIVAHRIVNPTGNASRVFIRALATEKDAAAQTFTVFGFAVDASTASLHWDSDGDGIKEDFSSSAARRAAFFAAVLEGRTALKVRAAQPADVDPGAKTWKADEVEIEGYDD